MQNQSIHGFDFEIDRTFQLHCAIENEPVNAGSIIYETYALSPFHSMQKKLKMENTLIAKTNNDYDNTRLPSNDEIYANFDPLLTPEIINLLNEPRPISKDKPVVGPNRLTAYSPVLDEHELALS